MTNPGASPSWLNATNLVWLVIYLLCMAGVVFGLSVARERALTAMASPEAQANWTDFRSEMKRQAEDPKAPVARQPPRSEEPPALRLLRDYYGTCVALALVLCSALFITVMVMLRGVLGGERFVPRAD